MQGDLKKDESYIDLEESCKQLEDAKKKIRKSERLSNFALGFAIFVQLFRLFVEFVVKR